ncbi:MAG: CoA-binding protein [Bacteroidales bacterium]
MKAKKAQVDSFLAQPHIAVAGYSQNPKKFGSMVFETLREKGYNVYPVNPSGGKTPDGQVIYENLNALPAQVKAIYVVTKPIVSQSLVEQAIQKGFTHFWVQQMSENKAVNDLLQDIPEKVTGQCILMHTQPTGIHRFHWWLSKIFGTLPA